MFLTHVRAYFVQVVVVPASGLLTRALIGHIYNVRSRCIGTYYFIRYIHNRALYNMYFMFAYDIV